MSEYPFRAQKCSPRIGVDFHVFDGIFQGSRSHILGLFSAAIEIAPHLEFVFFLEKTSALKKISPVFSRPNVQLISMRRSPGPARLALQLPYLRYRHRIDLLHMQYRIPPISLGPCAVTIHDMLFESHPHFFPKNFAKQSKYTFRFAARHARLLFTVSEYSKAEICRRYNVLPQEMHVLHNAVDRSHYHPGTNGAEEIKTLGLDSNDYILTVGRLEPRKNHANILRAYALLPQDAPPLVIVGQKDFGWEDTIDMAGSLGISDKVRFCHDIDDKVLPSLMRHALFFVYPSYAEGFGMPVLEAMASGTAVITSDNTSLSEVAGGCALYVDPDSPDDIHAKMEQLLDDLGLRDSLQTGGLVQAEKFSWQDSAAKLVSVYDNYFSTAAAQPHDALSLEPK